MPTLRQEAPLASSYSVNLAVRNASAGLAAIPIKRDRGEQRAVVNLGKKVRFLRGSRPGLSATLASGLSLEEPGGLLRLRRPTQPDLVMCAANAHGPGNPETRQTLPANQAETTIRCPRGMP